MYMYMYTHTHTHKYIYIYIYIYTYVYTYIHIYICIYLCVCVCVCECIYLCIHILYAPMPPQGWTVCATGHSLGGALCTLFATEVKVRYPEIGCTVYNFGSPKVGDDEFVRRFNRLVPNTFRVVNDAVKKKNQFKLHSGVK